MNNTLATFQEGLYYHVYNRTNNKEDLYRSTSNRFFFKSLIIQYLKFSLKIYSYSFLANHFHLCVEVKSIKEILLELQKIENKDRTKTISKFIENPNEKNAVHTLVSHQFSRLFNCYTKSYNLCHNRKGNLFNRPFKRSMIINPIAFKLKIYYIHHNARKHGLVTNFEDHSWNSYHEILFSDSNVIDFALVYILFEGKNNYKKFHQKFLLPNEISFSEDLSGL